MSGEDLEEFIDLYHSAECLLNLKYKEYRDINARKKAHESITGILNLSTDLAKKKTNSLKSTCIKS